MEEDGRLRRILWRCRRGTRELDLVLCGFAEARYAALDSQDRNTFEALLDTQDPLLNDWLWNEQPAETRYAGIVKQILEYKNER